MSAIPPNGTRKAADDRRDEVATQLSSTASIENSSPMEGIATLIEEAMKGVTKELRTATVMADRLSAASDPEEHPASILVRRGYAIQQYINASGLRGPCTCLGIRQSIDSRI